LLENPEAAPVVWESGLNSLRCRRGKGGFLVGGMFMNNTLIIGIYAPFASISIAIFVVELLRRFKRQEDYLFSLLCFCAVGWFATNITGLLTDNAEMAKFCINFSLIFVGFIPPILLLFTLKFYKVSYQPSVKILLLMFSIPAINTIMAITSGYHTLMTARLDIISLTPLREVVLIWGSWFWVHTAYSYVISITLIIVILFQHFRLTRFYRLPSSLMVIGVSFTLLGNIVTLLELLPQAIDPTLITMSLSLILFSLAIINNNKSKFVRFSYRRIYNYLDLYILVLDKNHRVADFNRPALDWFSSQGITLNSSTMEDIAEALLCKENSLKKASENERGDDYYISSGDFPVVLNLRTHEMTDANGDIIGSIAVFTDVTQNRMLIERLEEKAGMDSLTGLANHMAYEGARKRLDVPEQLPLSVIVCDVNGLKAVNDNMGHQYGDMMLQAVAEIFETACPRPGFVARIGGDEFVYLLSHTSEEAAAAFMEKIREMMSSRKNLPFPLSVALGAATKFSPDENINDVIALADSRMYENKKWIKSQ